jgi:hypothetical protein
MELPTSRIPLNFEHTDKILGYVDSFQYNDNGGLQGIAYVNDDVELHSRNISLEYSAVDEFDDGHYTDGRLAAIAVTLYPADQNAVIIPYPEW